MDPLSQSPHPLVPCSQTVRYLPWLKVSVALRYVRTFPWAPEAWRESGSTFGGLWLSRTVFGRPGDSIER